MKAKIYTPEEATKTLPLVASIVKDLMATYLKVREITKSSDEPSAAQLDRPLANIQRFINELEDLGVWIRDLEKGHVDFYGDVGGDVVSLCWRPEDKEILYFHPCEEECSNRIEILTSASDPTTL